MISAAERRIGEMVSELPARARVFEKFGIDYCCQGKRTLKAACLEKGIPAESVLSSLAKVDAESSRAGRDLNRLSISDLIEHIVHFHHGYLKDELPRLGRLIEKVARAHGDRRPELCELEGVFREFSNELELHMMKEEAILFPALLQLEEPTGRSYRWGTIGNAVRVMTMEHNDAGDALRRIRELTSDFTLPPGACTSYRVLFHALEEFEEDLHFHIHKENNILFPKVLELERMKKEPAGVV